MTKMNQEVQAVFDAAPLHARETMLRLRTLIFEVAANLPEIGRIHETLRWGQPAYVTSKRAGASLRIAVPKTGGVALYTHCQTSLIADFTATFPGMDRVEGSRAVHFEDATQIDPVRHAMLITSVLTYHL